MTKNEALSACGSTCLNAAFVLTLSWVPALSFLEGSAWSSAKLVSITHFFAIGFTVLAPLVLGARLWAQAPAEDRAELIRDWCLRCLLPLLLYAAAMQGTIRLVPHITVGVIVSLMAAALPLGIYGVLLRREAMIDAS